MRLNDEQRATLEQLEQIVAKPDKQVSPYGLGAARALRFHLPEGQTGPDQRHDLDRVEALLAKAQR
jgi:hypothetical protein